MRRSFPNTPTTLALMALALALFYQSGTVLPALVGVLIFGALALPRPDLGLLFVPLSVPLYLIPAAIQGLRPASNTPFRLPIHEVALLAVFVATTANWLWRKPTTDDRRPTTDEQTRRQGDEEATGIADHISRFRFYV